MPLECAAAESIDASALAAGGSLSAAPEVVVDCVLTLDLVIPLTAEICALGKVRDRCGGCCGGESSSACKCSECR